MTSLREVLDVLAQEQMYRCTSSSCQIFRRESVCTAIQRMLKLMLAFAFQMCRHILGSTII